MITISGIPAHPLVIHAVVVLLPLAALGAILVAVRPSLRRTLGIPLALITLVGVIAVPLATQSGDQLKDALGGGGPLVAVHESRADLLLPWAIVFVVLVLAGLVSDRMASGGDGAAALARRRVSTAVAILAALAGIVVVGLVVWIGEAGAQAVWQGTGG